MARRIIKKDKEPKEITIGDKTVTICMCGLSSNQPFCDGSHKLTQNELDDDSIVYIYNDKKEIVGAEDLNESDSGCCGGGCCSNN